MIASQRIYCEKVNRRKGFPATASDHVDTLWTPGAIPLRELPPNGLDTGRSGTDTTAEHRNGGGIAEIAVGVVDESDGGVTIGQKRCPAHWRRSLNVCSHDPKCLVGSYRATPSLVRRWSAQRHSGRAVKEAKDESSSSRLHADLAIDGDAAATLEGLTDAYAEARLLRHCDVHAAWSRWVGRSRRRAGRGLCSGPTLSSAGSRGKTGDDSGSGATVEARGPARRHRRSREGGESMRARRVHEPLFAEFRASSWDGWRKVLARITGAVDARVLRRRLVRGSR